MLDTKDICYKFGTVQQYDVFCKEWAKACYQINSTEQNKDRLEESKTSYIDLLLKKESEQDGGIHESDKG